MTYFWQRAWKHPWLIIDLQLWLTVKTCEQTRGVLKMRLSQLRCVENGRLRVWLIGWCGMQFCLKIARKRPSVCGPIRMVNAKTEGKSQVSIKRWMAKGPADRKLKTRMPNDKKPSVEIEKLLKGIRGPFCKSLLVKLVSSIKIIIIYYLIRKDERPGKAKIERPKSWKSEITCANTNSGPQLSPQCLQCRKMIIARPHCHWRDGCHVTIFSLWLFLTGFGCAFRYGSILVNISIWVLSFGGNKWQILSESLQDCMYWPWSFYGSGFLVVFSLF